jgi:TPR repeat protein
LVLGNIVVARQYFLRSATMGYANAAFRLAETYDPNELQRMNVLGPYPNPEEAKRWYRAAIDLGVNGAEGRLARLTTD